MLLNSRRWCLQLVRTSNNVHVGHGRLSIGLKKDLRRSFSAEGTVLKVNHERKSFNWAKRVVFGVYGTLALIPSAFTISAFYHYIVGHPKQVSRAYCFFAWTGFLCLPLSMVLLASTPFVLMFDYDKRTFFDSLQRTWAKWTIYPFFEPKFDGVEQHLKWLESMDREGVIYVSNHQSWTDIYSVLTLPVPIRFVSKKEIFYIPVVGWSMGLIGHVGVERSNKHSRRSIIDACVQKLHSDVSVYLFAEGTRSRDGFVQPFKRGAFIISKESNRPIIPVTIHGTGRLMPANRGETWMEDGSSVGVNITIHDPLYPEDFDDANALQHATKRVIEEELTNYSTLFSHR